MNRPVDWEPLASADPVPGDPDEIQAIGRRHGDLADELEAQARMLRRLSAADGWDADAGRRFSSTAREIGDDLDRVRVRYSAVAQALRDYVPELEQAQREADAALRDARTAQSTIADLSVATGLGLSTDPARTTDRARAYHLDDAQAALSRARRRLADAVEQRDVAGRRAAGRIRAASEHDGLKDSWWDTMKGWSADRWDSFISWVHQHAGALSAIADVCGWLASSLAVVAIAVSFIPVLDFLTPLLLAAATALTIVSFTCHVMLALAGDGSWVDVGYDVLGLVTFGYGTRVVRGVEASERVVKTAAIRAVRRAGEKDLRRAVRPTGRRITTAARRASRSEVRRRATSQAKRVVREAEQVKASASRKLLSLEGGKAQQGARIQAMTALAPESGRAAAASRAALTRLDKAAIAGGVGVLSDVVDKAKVADPIKPVTTQGFGRYAHTGG